MFRSNISLPSSGQKNKPSEKQATKQVEYSSETSSYDVTTSASSTQNSETLKMTSDLKISPGTSKTASLGLGITKGTLENLTTLV
jgi:hypothetical protein